MITPGWPKEVLDITELKTILDSNKIDIAEDLAIVLSQDKNTAMPRGRRYQYVRFATILGAVNVPNSKYNKDEREKHLNKLRRYYDQNSTKAYIKPETAEFYCNFLNALKTTLERRHPGINWPVAQINKPKEKTATTSQKKPRTPKAPNNLEVVIDRYKVLNPSCLQALSPNDLSQILHQVLEAKIDTLGKDTKAKDLLVNLVGQLEYALTVANEQSSYLDHVRKLYTYKAGQKLSPEIQKLYVSYMEDVEDSVKKIPGFDVTYDEIPLLYEGRNIPQQAPAPEPQPTPSPEPQTSGIRLNSYTSDEWKQILDGSKTDGIMPVFLEQTANSLHLTEGLEIISLKEILGNSFPSNFDKLSAEEKENVVQKLKESMNASQKARFNVLLTEKAQTLAEALPPHQLVTMVRAIDDELKSNNDNRQTINLKAQKNVLIAAMADKVKGVALKNIVVDETNIADVYDGAMEMLEYLSNKENLAGIELEGEGEFSFDDLATMTKNTLNQQIISYDEIFGLTNIKPADAKKLEESFDEAWDLAEKADLNNTNWLDDETIARLGMIEFENPDADKKKQTFIETIKLEAARGAAVAAYGKGRQELLSELKTQLNVVANNHMRTLLATDVIANLPENITNKERDHKIASAVMALVPGNSPLKVSDKGAIAYQAAVVNNHVSFLNRLAGKAHLNDRSAKVLQKMYRPLAKIDKTCIARFGNKYLVARKFGSMMKRNMASQAINQALRIGCNTASLALGVPGLGSQIYAGVYAAQALARLTKAYVEERKASKEKGLKFFGKFLAQKSPEILMSAASTAAIFFGGEIARLGMEKVARFGMMGIGFTISAIKGARANRKSGEKWGKAISKALANSAASTGTAVLTGMGMAWGVNQFSSYVNNTSLDLWGEHGTRQPTADEYNADDPTYSKTPITADELNDYKNMSPEELNEHGISKDPIAAQKALELVDKSDEQLANDGIIREQTNAEDTNGVKVVDQEASAQYSQEALNNAERSVRYWTSANPEVYQENMAALDNENSPLSRWNAEHPDRIIDAHRLELIVAYSGGQMVASDVDTLQNHVDGDLHNENPVDVKGNHKLFGAEWIDTYGKELNISNEDISAIASLHNPDGSIDMSKMAPEVLDAIERIDAQNITVHNEVGDVASTRDDAHRDGILDRNVMVDETGKHVHSNNGEMFNSYANGETAKHVTPEQAHYEKFDQFSKVEQHSYIPFTVTFDRIWSSTRKLYLNTIMGANGKHKETVTNTGEHNKPAGIKPIAMNQTQRS